MRLRWLVVCVWTCFLVRGWFYASMFPLWEGYDEFAHFGVIRAMVVQGLVLPPRDQRGPRDVQESLKLAPVPWEVRTWSVFQGSLTHEEYWKLTAGERRQRQAKLQSMPASWRLMNSDNGVSAYEALQPPLYYWLMTPVLRAVANSGLPGQVILLRWISVAIASLAIPLTFAIARRAIQHERAAFGCAAVVALMPGLAIDVARVSNESVSILLFSLLAWMGLKILAGERDTRNTVLLGLFLGLGLLTKAYFLTAVPAVLLLLVYAYGRKYRPALIPIALAFAIAGWWYVRNLVTTGTLSGLAEPIILRTLGTPAMIRTIPAIPWLRGVDVILQSHLYFCGWSSLAVRSWTYHLFYAIVIVAALGVLMKIKRPAILWLLALYGTFWIGQLYNVWLQFLTKGLAGSMGWYIYALVATEVVLCVAAFGRLRTWVTAAGAILFGLLDLYGMHWLAIPYYTGMIGHKPNGALSALHMSDFRIVGFQGAFERLAVNKCALISSRALMVFWLLYLVGTVFAMVLALRSPTESGGSPDNRNTGFRHHA